MIELPETNIPAEVRPLLMRLRPDFVENTPDVLDVWHWDESQNTFAQPKYCPDILVRKPLPEVKRLLDNLLGYDMPEIEDQDEDDQRTRPA